ncbi:MAG: NUDIX hydrolase [candidate division WOR-3 bacterium]|nr:MAG: NUDIX hydrolase [candidate division WOR-3 bacterium]
MRDAVAVVIKKDGRFLLIKRAKKGEAEDFWCPITGAVEDGETQEQAVVREASEEMGIRVEPIKKIWECMTHDRDYRLHWWQVDLMDGRIAQNPEEVKEYKWVTVSQMRDIEQMFEADRLFFRTIGVQLSDSTD